MTLSSSPLRANTQAISVSISLRFEQRTSQFSLIVTLIDEVWTPRIQVAFPSISALEGAGGGGFYLRNSNEHKFYACDNIIIGETCLMFDLEAVTC